MPYGPWEPCEDTQCPKCLGYRVNLRIYLWPDGGAPIWGMECVDCQHKWEEEDS